MKRCLATLSVCTVVLAFASVSRATVVGFGQIGGSNTAVPAGLASNAIADGNGFVVANGTTPNVTLTWDQNWDVHTSNFFTPIEDNTVGGGAWDNEGNVPRIGQLDFGTHTIGFAADPGYAVVLNSFDFGHTAETAGTTNWDLTLTDAGANAVWSQSVEFVNGSVITVAPNFTGAFGQSYTLTFNRTGETYGSNGRHAIDNLSFNQVAVPEPATLAFAGLGALGLVTCGRRR